MHQHPLPIFAKDFRLFAYRVFEALGHKLSKEDDWILYDIAHYLQHGPSRRQVRAMRGVGKSVMCAAYIVWRIYCDPNITIGVVAGAANLAQDLVELSRKIIDLLEMCHHLKPKEEDKDGAFQFVTGARTRPSKDKTVWACGLTSQKTGHHFDLLIGDDLETPENSDDPFKRERVLYLVSEFEDLINPGGQGVLLNTPQHNNSVYIALEKRSWIARTWPAEYPLLSDHTYTKNVAPSILERLAAKLVKTGDPTYPKRFGVVYLDSKKASYGLPRFALQMNCDTRLADQSKYPLKLANFIVHPCHHDSAPKRIVWGTSEAYDGASIEMAHGTDKFYRPIMVSQDHIPYDMTLMFIDPSGGGSVSGDEVAWAIGKVAGGMIFITESGGLMGGHCEANMKHLARRAKAHGVKKVLVEGNYGKGMFSKLLAPYMGDINGPTAIEDVYSTNTAKEKRIIDSLATPMATHRVVIDEMVAKDSILMAQLTNIAYQSGSLRHDDRVEALACCVAALANYLPALSQERSQLEEDKVALEKVWKRYRDPRASIVGHDTVILGVQTSRPSVLTGKTQTSGSQAYRNKINSILKRK
jgi:hypothetical protein